MKRLLVVLFLSTLFCGAFICSAGVYDNDGIKFSYKIYSSGAEIWNIEVTKSGHVDFPQTVSYAQITKARNAPVVSNATSIDFGSIICEFYGFIAPNLTKFKGVLAQSLQFNCENIPNLDEIELPSNRPVSLYKIAKDFTLIAPETTEITLTECNGLSQFRHNGVSILSIINCENIETIETPSATSLKFTNCPKLQNISAPNATVLNSAKDCPSLKVIDMPKLEMLGKSCFEGCSSLESANLSNVTSIGDKCFLNCSSLKTVSLNKIERLPEYLFSGCTSLLSVELPETFDYIPKGFFMNCSSIKNLSLPWAKIVNESAFEGCETLEHLDLPACEKVCKNAFSRTWALRKLEMPSLKTIEANGFSNCGLEEFGSTNEISLTKNTFTDCPNLKVLYLPNSAITYVDAAIINCPVLEKLVLGITNIRTTPFRGLTNLKVLRLDKVSQISFDDRIKFTTEVCANLNLDTVSMASLPKIENWMMSGWPMRNLYASGAKRIDSKGNMSSESALSRCENLKCVHLPNVESIGANAFEGCPSLEKVYIPLVTNIETAAFRNCTSLIDFTADNLKTLGNETFRGCSKLSDVVLNDSVTCIPARCFADCGSIKSIRGKKIEILEDGAFQNCQSLAEVDIPNLRSIKADALNGTSSLSLINVTNLAELYANSLRGSNITEFKTGEKLLNVSGVPFNECPQLKSITIPNIEYGGILAKNCPKLEYLSLGMNVANQFPTEGISTLKELFLDKVTGFGGNWSSSVAEARRNTELQTVSFASLRKVESYMFEKWPMRRMLLASVDTVCDARIISSTFMGIKYGPSPLGDSPNLEYLALPNVKAIGAIAVQNCPKLQSVDMPNVEYLGKEAFSNCGSLSETNTPLLKTIKDGAFKNCTSLAKVELPCIETIGNNVFENAGLKNVKMNNPIAIGDRAFSGCDLDVIEVNAPTPPEVRENTFSKYDALLIVPGGMSNNQKRILQKEASQNAVAEYKKHPIWGKFFIPDIEFRMMFGATYNYSNYTKPVKGVTADGEAKIFINLGSKELDKNYTIKLTGIDINTNDVGSFEPICLSLKEPEEKVLYGFQYTAPQEFPVNYENSSFKIKVELYKSGKKQAELGEIEVYRPGILLVHGLMSSDECWKSFVKYLQGKSTYNDWQIQNVNYQSSNTSSFEENNKKNLVIDKNIATLERRMLEEHGIVSQKYILVGHSMGGILSRLFAQKEQPGEGIHGAGSIHVDKIITVNTPHFGSELANTNLLIEIGSCGLFSLFEYLLDLRAFHDLSPFSEAITELNTSLGTGGDVPIHAVASYMVMPSDVENPEKSNQIMAEKILIGLAKWVGFILSVGSYDAGAYQAFENIYGGPNDGIVSLKSQVAGLPHNAKTILSDKIDNIILAGVWSMKCNAHHTKITDWDIAQNHIYNTLLEPTTSDKFSRISAIKKETKSLQQRNLESRDSIKIPPISETSAISISAYPGENKVTKVHVSHSQDVINNITMMVVNEDEAMTGMSLDDYEFLLPDTISGKRTFYSVGRNTSGELCLDSCTVEFSVIDDIAAIEFEEKGRLSLMKGERLPVNVIGIAKTGDKQSLSAKLDCDKTSVATVEDMYITGVNPGVCTLTASFKGYSASIEVEVKENPAGVSNVDDSSGIEVSVVGHDLIIRSKKNTTVSISDIVGRNVLVELQEGETKYRIESAGIYFIGNKKLIIR